MDKVTYLTTPPTEDKKTAPKFPKLDIKLAQNFCENTLETPKIEETSEITLTSKVSKSTVERKDILQASVDLIQIESSTGDTENKSVPSFEKTPESMEIDVADSLLSEGIDCVVNEEVVETSEFVESSNTQIPEIVLTETATTIDVTSDDEGMFCPDLLKPADILEESSSDHGYESYDSPISEPEELVNLFPELW